MARWWSAVVLCACAPTPAVLQRGLAVPEVRAVPEHGELVLRCQPKDADVLVDGVLQGTCDDYDGEPRGLTLGDGRAVRHVEVKKRGFSSWETWTATDGTRVALSVQLVPTGGSAP